MPPDAQIILMEGRTMRSRQVRHYSDEQFIGAAKA
jgi:hypothetical protein